MLKQLIMIKSRIEELTSDYFQWIPLVMSFLMALVNWWQFYDAGVNNSLVRCVFWAVQIPAVFLFGRKATFIWLVLYSQLLVYVNGEYRNFTSFFIITICCILQSKYEAFFLFLYAFNTCVIAQLHHVEISSLVFHFIFCAGLIIGIKFAVSSKLNGADIQLTVDEEKILEQLLSGVCQNAVDGYSNSTVTRKLKEARKRNAIASTEELLKEFKKYKEKQNKEG